MDIALPDHSGIDLAFWAKQKYPDVEIIFITGYNELVEDIFVKIQPRAYISKPIKNSLLFSHLDKIRLNLNNDKQFFEIKTKSVSEILRFREIIYFESNRRKIVVHTLNGEYGIYGKIDDIMADVPDYYARTHKSFLVNLYYLEGGIQSKHITLLDGTQLPVSRANILEVTNKYYKFKGMVNIE